MDRTQEEKIKNDLICSHAYEILSEAPIKYINEKRELEVNKILESLKNNNITAIDDFISCSEEIDTIYHPTAISLLDILDEGSKTYDMFHKILEEIHNIDLLKVLSYKYLEENNKLADALSNLSSMVHINNIEINEENLFVIKGFHSADYKLIATEDTIYYKTDSGYANAIPMDGSHFVFDGNKYEASINTLKLLEIIYYDGKFKVKDNLTGNIENENKLENKNKLKI